MSTTSGAAPASSGTSTEAMTIPAAPSDQASDERSVQTVRPSPRNCFSRNASIRRSAIGSSAEIHAPEMPLAGRRSPLLATVSR